MYGFFIDDAAKKVCSGYTVAMRGEKADSAKGEQEPLEFTIIPLARLTPG